jgi:hypothetical protein
MRSNILFAIVALIALVASGPAVAGERSEGAAAVSIPWASPPAPIDTWPSHLPLPACDPGDRTALEVGRGVDSVHGPYEVQYGLCLKAIPFPGSPLPQFWYVYNTYGEQTFFSPVPPPANPPDEPQEDGKLYITVDDHLQLIDYTTGMGKPVDGWVQGDVLGGTGRFEGARGILKVEYGSPQFLSGYYTTQIHFWSSMVLN